MNELDLSIIVPVYNVEKYLRQCLDSLVNQDYQNFEIICINDGSNDNSEDILKEYSSKYSFLSYYSKENGGLSSARNYGINYAKGKYIGFIDSDDYVEGSFISKMLKKAKENDSDIVVCDINSFYEDNSKPSHILEGLNHKYPNLDSRKRLLVSSMFAWNKIYKREFFLRENILYPEGLLYEDLEVSSYLGVKSKGIDYVKEVLINYRQRENSIMSTKNRKVLDIFEILRRLYERFDSNGLLSEYHDEICWLFIENLLLYGLFRLMYQDDYRDLYLHSKSFLKSYFPNWRNNKYIKDLPRKYRLFVLYNNSFVLPLLRKKIINI